MNIEILLGKTEDHLTFVEESQHLVHREMLKDFLRLRQASRLVGFELQIASAFRSYDRQLHIWNAKARGERPLFDDQGRQLDFSILSPTELMFAILRWSAVPGCSRHHWGTDIDVFDGKAQKPEDVKLIPHECEGKGPSSPMHQWLDSMIEQGQSFGFYRPYKEDLGGVAPERWHLSYYPFAHKIMNNYTHSIFRKNLQNPNILLNKQLLEHSDEVFQRYFANTHNP